MYILKYRDSDAVSSGCIPYKLNGWEIKKRKLSKDPNDYVLAQYMLCVCVCVCNRHQGDHCCVREKEAGGHSNHTVAVCVSFNI